ncbi:MFS transporter [Novosphingobium panipatense]
MATGETGASQEWKRGWPVVLAAVAGFSFFSVVISATGLFIEPLERDFGWDRATLSMGPAIATAVTALLSPFYGALIDRFGSRRLGIPGVVTTMAATCMFAFANGSTTQWIVMWIVFGLILTSIKSTIWTTAVAGTFSKGRGLALGLAVTGPAIAQTLVPPLGNMLIESFGWRAAYVWFGLGWEALPCSCAGCSCTMRTIGSLPVTSQGAAPFRGFTGMKRGEAVPSFRWRYLPSSS